MPVESENSDMETLDVGSGAAERVGSEWGLLPSMVGVVGTVFCTAEGASVCDVPRVLCNFLRAGHHDWKV